jgi:uncharacterized protein (DUF2141 family)
LIVKDSRAAEGDIVKLTKGNVTVFVLPSGRRKIMKVLLITILVVAGIAGAPTLTFSGEIFAVSGQVTFPKTGNVFIYLETKEEETAGKATPQERIAVIKLSPEQMKGRKASFSFAAVPRGEYCIKAFQDVNGNGKMDLGLWTVSEEPYGGYKSCWPFRWDAAKFKVDKDIGGIDIQLQQ